MQHKITKSRWPPTSGNNIYYFSRCTHNSNTNMLFHALIYTGFRMFLSQCFSLVFYTSKLRKLCVFPFFYLKSFWVCSFAKFSFSFSSHRFSERNNFGFLDPLQISLFFIGWFLYLFIFKGFHPTVLQPLSWANRFSGFTSLLSSQLIPYSQLYFMDVIWRASRDPSFP
jgi:hypothetical protein